MSLAQRSITSVTWKIVANLASVVVLFVRSILLARWLPVDVFGIYALASSIVQLSVRVADFGMSGAFVHRAPETQDETKAAAVHFTFRMSFTLLWAIVLIGGTFLFTNGQLRTALLLLTATTAVLQSISTPSLILLRRVMQRRVAVIQLLTTLISTPIMLWLAWQGVTLWALLAGSLVGAIVNIILWYVWHPVWRPQLAWESSIIRYFLRFGSRNFLGTLLYDALDRIDDLWVGFFLGQTPLGFYSRAYNLATYPRKLLAQPINVVVGGTYAELKGDRSRLSRIFFGVNALMLRASFFLAGLLALVTPEFIHLILGTKWLPMLNAFRWMLIFTLFDPIKRTLSSLLGMSVGKPELVVRARLVQLALLTGGLFLLGPPLGITGVAIAVDVMLVVGIAILLWYARTYVDFSVRRLFAAPVLALTVGLVLAASARALPIVNDSYWQTGLVKAVTFTVAYGVTLLGLERRQCYELFVLLTRHTTGRVKHQDPGVP